MALQLVTEYPSANLSLTDDGRCPYCGRVPLSTKNSWWPCEHPVRGSNLAPTSALRIWKGVEEGLDV